MSETSPVARGRALPRLSTATSAMVAIAAMASAPFLVWLVRWWLANDLALVSFSLAMPIAAGAAVLLTLRIGPADGHREEAASASGAARRVAPPAAGALALAAGGLALDQPILGAAGLWLAAVAAAAALTGRSRAARLAVGLTPLLLTAPLTAGWPGRGEALLQRLSAMGAELWLTLLQVPVVRDGLVLRTPAYWNRVDDTCSGLSTVTGLYVYAVLLGLLLGVRTRRLLAVAAATLPLGLVVNAGRIAWISILGERGGPDLALGTLHDVAGYASFGVAWVGLLGLLLWARRRR